MKLASRAGMPHISRQWLSVMPPTTISEVFVATPLRRNCHRTAIARNPNSSEILDCVSAPAMTNDDIAGSASSADSLPRS